MRKIAAWSWFALIQIVSFVLMIVGWFLLIPLSAKKAWTICPSTEFPGQQIEVWNGGKWTWLWGNEENGVIGNVEHKAKFTDDRIGAYLWSAWRNPVNNMRFVVKWVGGPFYRWENAAKTWYFQCGWYPNGFPVLSAGRM